MRDRSFLAVCALIFVNQLGFGLIVPVLPLYARSLGLAAGDIGLVVGIYGFARFMANVPAGLMADRRGRRQVMVLGTAITSIASALMVTATDLPQLLAYRLLAGLGAATVITAGQIMVGDIATPENRGRLMSVYQGVFLIGVSAGPLPAGLLADHLGLRAPFVAYAVFSATACVLAMFLIRETRPAPGTPSRPSEAHAATGGGAGGLEGAASLRATLLSPAFVLIGFVSFSQFVGRTGSVFVLVPLIGDQAMHLTSSQISVAIFLVNFLNFATVYFSGSLADRFGRKVVIAPATVIAGVSLAMFAFSSAYPVYLLAAAVWGFGSGLSGPAPAAYVADFAPSELRARVFGYFRSVSDSGYIVGPMVLGWAAGRWGFEFPLLVNAGMIAVSGALFWVLAPEFHRSRRAAATTPPAAPASR